MRARASEVLHISGRDVDVTRPEKVLFPDDGITKGDLIRYYERISPWMLPHLKGRPLALQRFPDGIDRPGFFQKAAARYYPPWIRKATVRKAGGTVTHVVCDEEATLIYLANQACVTLHTWLSRSDQIDYPDQMIFDLDPSTKDLGVVIAGADAVRDVLEGLGMATFVRSTGSRGLHVVVPLDRSEDFDSVRSFARSVAERVASLDPDRFTTEQRREKRRGRLFLDINRNAYAQTAVASYSVRARKGAPVSVPLRWAELRSKNFRPDAFTIGTVFERLEQIEDPWQDFARRATSLKKARTKFQKEPAG